MGIVVVPTFGADPVTITGPTLDAKVDGLATEFNGSIDNDNIDSAAAIANSKLNLASVSQNVTLAGTNVLSGATTISGALTVSNTQTMSGKAINMAKGSDIASDTTTDIGAMIGNYGDVTGTTTITGLGTVQAGTSRVVRFTGALILTHNGTSLLLPTAANITTVANDTAEFVSLGSGNWKCLWYQRYDGRPLTAPTASAGTVVQTVNVTNATKASGTTDMPNDNTIPQSGEGNEFMTLAITPTSATNKLLIRIVAHLSTSANSGYLMGALFQDSTANCLAAGMTNGSVSGSNGSTPMIIEHYMDAGTTSSTTFKYRAGGTASATVTFNGVADGQWLGGKLQSSITIMEIKV